MTRCAFFFSTAAQRQTSGLTVCAESLLHRCANAAEHRPAVAKYPRHREAGRRKDGTTMTPRTPRKGRLRPVKLQLNPTHCSFHLLPILVYRKGHLCGIPMPLSPNRRLPSTATPRGRPPRRRNVTTFACRGRAASGQGSLILPKVLAALAERCSWESSRSCGTM